MLISIPVAVGELIDKITICQIKIERLASSPESAKAVEHELALLEKVRVEYKIEGPALEQMMAGLKTTNARLWEIEDRIRDCERRNEFSENFVALARSVYKINDRRAATKREIDAMFGSAIKTEKFYPPY